MLSVLILRNVVAGLVTTKAAISPFPEVRAPTGGYDEIERQGRDNHREVMEGPMSDIRMIECAACGAMNRVPAEKIQAGMNQFADAVRSRWRYRHTH